MAKRIIARWHDRDFILAGQPLKLKLKAVSHEEAPEFLKAMIAFANESKKARIDGVISDPFAHLDPKFAGECFQKWVRPAEEIEDEDGRQITTGLDVYGLVNSGVAFAVLIELQNLAILTATEGKASSSPSTSAAGTGTTDAGGSPVTSTGPGDGTAP